MNKNLALTALLGLLSAQAALAVTPAKYAIATRDSAVADSNEIVNNLDALTPDNASLVWNADKTRIKVVTWKSQSAYQNFLLPYTETSANENFVVWVTLAPKMQEFCRNFVQQHPKISQANLDYRLKQRLGLHPDWQYDVFVELWVNPADVFRPCVDPAPNDSSCELNFGSTAPTVKNIKDYPNFYKNLYFGSFRAAPGVPWTGLGYTYDWRNASNTPGAGEQGASEFILSPSTPYQIDQAVPTFQYCQP